MRFTQKYRQDELIELFEEAYPEVFIPSSPSEAEFQQMFRMVVDSRKAAQFRYEPEYARSRVDFAHNSKLQQWCFDQVQTIGLEGLNPNRPTFIALNHLSHADFILPFISFNDFYIRQTGNVRPVLFFASEHLDRIRTLKFLGLDFGKLGAIWFDRDLTKANGRRVEKYVQAVATEEILDHAIELNPITSYFPEGRRAPDRKRGEFKKGFVDMIVEKKRDVDVLGGAMVYSRRIEEDAFPYTQRFKDRKTPLQRAMYMFPDGLVYATTIAGGVARQLAGKSPPPRQAYIQLGKPVHISDVVNWEDSPSKRAEDLTAFTQDEIDRNYSELRRVRRRYNAEKRRHRVLVHAKI